MQIQQNHKVIWSDLFQNTVSFRFLDLLGFFFPFGMKIGFILEFDDFDFIKSGQTFFILVFPLDRKSVV